MNYDSIADVYNCRYQRFDYHALEREVLAFAAGRRLRTIDVGCGTGHWLSVLASHGENVVGLDPSGGMLWQVRGAAIAVPVIQGHAEALPLRTESVDRVLCVNALHHFTDIGLFFREARRILRPGGGLLTIGLDPHAVRDQWWIYDYFPEALAADFARYKPTAQIQQLMTEAGFTECETHEAQRMQSEIPISVALETGVLEQSSTSQLIVIGDEAYRTGMERIQAAHASSASGEPVLHADLRLYATTGWLPSSAPAQSIQATN